MQNLNMQTIEKTIQNLKRNYMDAYYCATSKEAVCLAQTLMKAGDVVTHGGSVTLSQIGMIEVLKSGDYVYLDRNAEGLTREDVLEIYNKAFSADVFLTSSNAITENGELYNVDGNSNRVAAILYGPKSVIVFAGYNKIVPTIDDAIRRVKTKAAPPNAARLNCSTYCAKAGQCVSLNQEESFLCDGCHSDDRICCNYVVSAQQRHRGRIKVILIGEELGY